MFRSVSRFATRSRLLLPSLQQSLAQPLAQQQQVITPVVAASLARTPALASPRWSSTNHNDDKYFHRTSFVHPLSQIVLEYLQSRKSGWLLQQGLDKYLTINADGSFEMKYPSMRNPSNPPARIFTFYDRKEAKHFLVVQKGYNLHEKFMLQDNKASPWHANKKSVYDRIHVSVDEMIHAVERLDGLHREKMQQQNRSSNNNNNMRK